MLKKNALNDEQLDRVRGGLDLPYVDNNFDQAIPFNNKSQGLDLDISGNEPTNGNPMSGYTENETKEQKFKM